MAQSTVAKYMAKSGRGRSQTWKTFLRNHAAGVAAMDFLIMPTVGFKLLFVLVILRYQRRRLISLSVTANPTAEWIARQITETGLRNRGSGPAAVAAERISGHREPHHEGPTEWSAETVGRRARACSARSVIVWAARPSPTSPRVKKLK